MLVTTKMSIVVYKTEEDKAPVHLLSPSKPERQVVRTHISEPRTLRTQSYFGSKLENTDQPIFQTWAGLGSHFIGCVFWKISLLAKDGKDVSLKDKHKSCLSFNDTSLPS